MPNRAPPARPSDPVRDAGAPVVIVGAGAAGLACARVLHARGVPHRLLEGAASIGGRARTTTPTFLDGAWLDEGASWLHAPDRNPLVPLARDAGIELADAWSDRHHHLVLADGRPATDADRDRYARAETAYAALLESRDADAADVSLAVAGTPFRDEDPWGPSLETWEGAIIAAADAPVLSLRDWRANRLPGGDLAVAGGVGRLLATVLAPPDPDALRLETVVRAIDRTPRDHLLVETDRGTLRAAAVVVTASTGVLRADAIRFVPALPAGHRDALARLPMGLLSKIALRLAPGVRDPFGVPTGDGALLERQVGRPGEPALLVHLQPRGLDHLVGFHGGEAAWAVAHDARAADDFARAELARRYGADAVRRTLRPGAYATTWGIDPLQRGAYAYAGPGDVPARAALAAPVDGGRLVFAGEACRDDGLAGTVGGAARDGARAAEAVLAALGAARSCGARGGAPDGGRPWPSPVPTV